MNIFELYKKCIKGECTPEEAVLVERWLKDHPDAFEDEMLSEMQDMGAADPMPESVRQEMLAHFKGLEFLETGRVVGIDKRKRAVVREEENVSRMDGHKGGRQKRLVRWVAAASVMAMILTGVWIYGGKKTDAGTAVWAEIGNEGAGVRLVLLPDSSRIWLNAGTHIRYRIGDDLREERVIQLTGEAYFKVKTQAGRSFTVMAGNTMTRVLGTEFNIEAYPGETMVRVILQGGKVQVSSLDEKGATKDSKTLEPGQAAIFHRDSASLSIYRTALDSPQEWIRETLVLNDVSLADALTRIGRRYKKRMVFDADKARQYAHIKANYRNPTIDQVLMQLGFTCDFKFKKDSNTYTISFDKGGAH